MNDVTGLVGFQQVFIWKRGSTCCCQTVIWCCSLYFLGIITRHLKIRNVEISMINFCAIATEKIPWSSNSSKCHFLAKVHCQCQLSEKDWLDTCSQHLRGGLNPLKKNNDMMLWPLLLPGHNCKLGPNPNHQHKHDKILHNHHKNHYGANATYWQKKRHCQKQIGRVPYLVTQCCSPYFLCIITRHFKI